MSGAASGRAGRTVAWTQGDLGSSSVCRTASISPSVKWGHGLQHGLHRLAQLQHAAIQPLDLPPPPTCSAGCELAEFETGRGTLPTPQMIEHRAAAVGAETTPQPSRRASACSSGEKHLVTSVTVTCRTRSTGKSDSRHGGTRGASTKRSRVDRLSNGRGGSPLL